MTRKDLRRLTYQMTKVSNLDAPFNSTDQSGGKKFRNRF